MTLSELTAILEEQHIHLSARLVIDAPLGVMTPKLRSALTVHKSLLLQRVVREMVWAELSTLRWGPAVDDPTSGIDRP